MYTHKYCHFLVIWTIILLSPAFSQPLNLIQLTTLPPEVKETSGIDLNGPDHIWTHNDSGNPAELYKINTAGQILKTITVSNATNTDWEDLARDDMGNFYIGDFGNNTNSRTDLRILKIPNPDSIAGNQVAATVIEFSFQDQAMFPPPISELQFDVEAFFWHQDSLYLFSKNRTDPYDGITRLYRLPDMPGTYSAMTIDSFYTGGNDQLNSWVTGADISPDGNRVALVSTDKIWLFSCYQGTDFFGGTSRQFDLPSPSQKEAICFYANDQLFVTDEEVTIGPLRIGRNLYGADISNWIDRIDVNLGGLITSNDDSVILDVGVANGTYLWNTGETSQQIVVRDSGFYSVVVNLGPCSGSDTVQVTFMTTAIDQEVVQEEPGEPQAPEVSQEEVVSEPTHPLRVSPNPFERSTELSFDLPAPGNVLVEAFNMDSIKLARFRLFHQPEGEINIQLNQNNMNLSPGAYILVISSGDWKIERKIVKVK